MKKIYYLLFILYICMGACKNKDLDYENNCDPNDKVVKVVINWETPDTPKRTMHFKLFSLTNGIAHYGRDEISQKGEKCIKLSEGASYLPFCYDYNASNIHFRNENDGDLFEAYCPNSTRSTYENYANKVEGEQTVASPRDFYVDCPGENFDVVYKPESPDTLLFHFYPRNIVWQFTYCIKNIVGINNTTDTRGAISGMSSSYHFKSGEISATRCTVLFENGIRQGTNTEGDITGSFYTFGPVMPCENRFTIEILTRADEYLTAHWNVSDQIAESMNDREAKLARDGYDILIINKGEIPEIPNPEEKDSPGFNIEVGEWNNVIIYL